MSGNTFGTSFKLTSFGESHAKCVGGVIDGVIPGLEIDMNFIQTEMNRRKPGQSNITTQRFETDFVEFISGIIDGKTTGTPLAFLINNNNHNSQDYNNLKNIFRPSHADYTYFKKYGIRDYKGGGRASGRETAVRVVGGAIAKLMLQKHKINVIAFTSQIGEIKLDKHYLELDISLAENNIVRCPDQIVANKMIEHLKKVKEDNDSVGGVVTCVIKNVPAGIGEPIFDKLSALLARAMLSIGGAKGFEYGSGFRSAEMRGSQHNDIFYTENRKIRTVTNYSGGIQGGISNGEDIYFKVAFKPVPSINRTQKTVDIDGNLCEIKIEGMHDVCIVPRAVVVVEAMAAMTIIDLLRE
ncbi:MAG: chorismate synthase [Marinilabiliaceae bacterium]|nr:chorismate synthase [Marinilabiliaceae bacterium]